MQPKWLVIARGRELGEFASRYAAMVFAERLLGREGPYTVRERSLIQTPQIKPLGDSEADEAHRRNQFSSN